MNCESNFGPARRTTGSVPFSTLISLLDAVIAGERLPKPNWNLPLDEMLRRAMKRVGSFEKLQLDERYAISGDAGL